MCFVLNYVDLMFQFSGVLKSGVESLNILFISPFYYISSILVTTVDTWFLFLVSPLILYQIVTFTFVLSLKIRHFNWSVIFLSISKFRKTTFSSLYICSYFIRM